MGYLLLNQSFGSVDIIESYDSLIWTERYSKAGDFEIFQGLTPQALELYKKDYYIYSDESLHAMIIEDAEIEKTNTGETRLVVSGRSLESILDRRIVWRETVLTGSLQNAVLRLLNENAIVPSDTSRVIPGLVFEGSTDPKVTSLTVDLQLLGESLYEAIEAICESNGIGFRITLSADNQFIFKLYAGVDRTYDQIVNPQVIFSPTFDNVGASKYLTSRRTLKTVGLVGGEGEGPAKKFVTVARAGGGAGLARREMYVSSSANSSNGSLTAAQYAELMRMEGSFALSDSRETAIFDGEIYTTETFMYNRDFALGDLVQLEDDYVEEALGKSRVVEFIRSYGASGTKAYPTLKSVD